MAAPTPVSAYLHAASMVKAGVYLVALLAPALRRRDRWRTVLLVLGLTTMLLGGVRALRQHDLKLLLAYGTVSQLGFLVLVLGTGTRSAMLAGLALLLAHALFKATLFLVVGVIDHSTGTRDLRELTGLAPPAAGPRRHRDARRRVDGGSAPAARLRRQGERARRARRRRPRRRRHRDRYDGRLAARRRGGRRVDPHRGLLGPLRVGRLRQPGGRRLRASVHSPSPAFIAAARRPGGARRWCSASSVPRSRRSSTPRPTSSRPGPTSPSSRCGTASGCPWCSPSSRSPRGAALFVAREPRRPHAGRAGPRLEPRAGLPRRHAPARPHGGRGHRCRAARLRGGVPRDHPDRAGAAARLDAARRPRRRAGDGVGQPRAGGHRRRHRRRGRADGALAAPDPRGPARRRHRLRHGASSSSSRARPTSRSPRRWSRR